jgi:hypothetical protein
VGPKKLLPIPISPTSIALLRRLRRQHAQTAQLFISEDHLLASLARLQMAQAIRARITPQIRQRQADECGSPMLFNLILHSGVHSTTQPFAAFRANRQPFHHACKSFVFCNIAATADCPITTLCIAFHNKGSRLTARTPCHGEKGATSRGTPKDAGPPCGLIPRSPPRAEFHRGRRVPCNSAPPRRRQTRVGAAEASLAEGHR